MEDQTMLGPEKPYWMQFADLYRNAAPGTMREHFRKLRAQAMPFDWNTAREYYGRREVPEARLAEELLGVSCPEEPWFDSVSRYHTVVGPWDFIHVPHMEWGDYVGGSINRANYEVWSERYADEKETAWWPTTGMYDYHGIVVLNHALTREMLDDIKGLVEHYPALDDDAVSRVEQVMKQEAWAGWLRYEFEDEGLKHLLEVCTKPPHDVERNAIESAWEGLGDAKLLDLFLALEQEHGNIEWIDENNSLIPYDWEEKLLPYLTMQMVWDKAQEPDKGEDGTTYPCGVCGKPKSHGESCPHCREEQIDNR